MLISGRGRLVMLAGEPGIGETLIAQELAGLAWARAAAKQGLLLFLSGDRRAAAN